uniref:ORF2b' protein n=1 Tax=Simian hemorrhagic fever virus TaxID=38143 RepID=A0A077EPK5_SHFV|nr:ORF2b' protein [Simian hemorrhagic fever virus]AIL48158.1 ORF2b' protein [Simian hemorrhagic fever virus]
MITPTFILFSEILFPIAKQKLRRGLNILLESLGTINLYLPTTIGFGAFTPSTPFILRQRRVSNITTVTSPSAEVKLAIPPQYTQALEKSTCLDC